MMDIHQVVHQIVQPNAGFFVAFAAASMALMAMALLADRAARHLSATARHSIVLAALLAWPVLFVAGVMRVEEPVRANANASAKVDVSGAVAAGEARPSEIACILASIWLIGASIALIRLFLAAQKWRAIARAAEPVYGAQVRIGCPVAVSESCSEPMVAGIFTPTILLPAGDYVASLTAAELDTVFAHELEHVTRRDNLLSLLTQLSAALFWFDPIHRLARRRLVELREQACDEAVIARGCDAEPYLAALAKSCQSTIGSSAVACMSRIRLRERMDSIMTYDRNRSSRSAVWIVRASVAAAIAIAAISFSILTPPASFASQETTSTNFDVKIAPREGGYNATVTVHAPDGAFTIVSVLSKVPDTATATMTRGERTYKFELHVNADGSGIADMEIREKDVVVARASKMFGPIPPPAPPRPKTVREGYERVGGSVRAPKPIHRVEPFYPEEDRAAGVQGIVILEVLISDAGKVEDVIVLRAVSSSLAATAADAARQWQFEPATMDGKPVAVIFNLTINFVLPDKS